MKSTLLDAKLESQVQVFAFSLLCMVCIEVFIVSAVRIGCMLCICSENENSSKDTQTP